MSSSSSPSSPIQRRLSTQDRTRFEAFLLHAGARLRSYALWDENLLRVVLDLARTNRWEPNREKEDELASLCDAAVSVDASVRMPAEHALRVFMQEDDEGACYLAHMISNAASPLQRRQLAGILLRNNLRQRGITSYSQAARECVAQCIADCLPFDAVLPRPLSSVCGDVVAFFLNEAPSADDDAYLRAVLVEPLTAALGDSSAPESVLAMLTFVVGEVTVGEEDVPPRWRALIERFLQAPLARFQASEHLFKSYMQSLEHLAMSTRVAFPAAIRSLCEAPPRLLAPVLCETWTCATQRSQEDAPESRALAARCLQTAFTAEARPYFGDFILTVDLDDLGSGRRGRDVVAAVMEAVSAPELRVVERLLTCMEAQSLDWLLEVVATENGEDDEDLLEYEEELGVRRAAARFLDTLSTFVPAGAPLNRNICRAVKACFVPDAPPERLEAGVLAVGAIAHGNAELKTAASAYVERVVALLDGDEARHQAGMVPTACWTLMRLDPSPATCEVLLRVVERHQARGQPVVVRAAVGVLSSALEEEPFSADSESDLLLVGRILDVAASLLGNQTTEPRVLPLLIDLVETASGHAPSRRVIDSKRAESLFVAVLMHWRDATDNDGDIFNQLDEEHRLRESAGFAIIAVAKALAGNISGGDGGDDSDKPSVAAAAGILSNVFERVARDAARADSSACDIVSELICIHNQHLPCLDIARVHSLIRALFGGPAALERFESDHERAAILFALLGDSARARFLDPDDAEHIFAAATQNAGELTAHRTARINWLYAMSEILFSIDETEADRLAAGVPELVARAWQMLVEEPEDASNACLAVLGTVRCDLGRALDAIPSNDISPLARALQRLELNDVPAPMEVRVRSAVERLLEHGSSRFPNLHELRDAWAAFRDSRH